MDFEHTKIVHSLTSPQRLSALYDTNLLNTPEDRMLNRLTAIICRDLDVPIALVTLVASDWQFFKSQQGLSGQAAEERGTEIKYSLCRYVVEQGSTIAIEDAREISGLKDHPAVAERDIVAYLGAPLLSGGQVIGSVCAADTKARHWTDSDMRMIERRANFVQNEINSFESKKRRFAG